MGFEVKKHETLKHEKLRSQFDRIFGGKRSRDYSKMVAHNSTRLYRALSWLKRFEDCNYQTDEAEQFLFLWISFDAAYGNTKKSNALKYFLKKVVEHDGKGCLARIMLSSKHKSDMLSLIRNEHLYEGFWDSQNSQRKNNRYENEELQDAMLQAEYLEYKTLEPHQTESVLCAVFNRLYRLRIQIFHGAATHGSSYNTSSLGPGCRVLGAYLPEFLNIMLEAMNKPGGQDMDDWGEIQYPPFRRKPDTGDEKPPKKGIS